MMCCAGPTAEEAEVIEDPWDMPTTNEPPTVRAPPQDEGGPEKAEPLFCHVDLLAGRSLFPPADCAALVRECPKLRLAPECEGAVLQRHYRIRVENRSLEVTNTADPGHSQSHRLAIPVPVRGSGRPEPPPPVIVEVSVVGRGDHRERFGTAFIMEGPGFTPRPGSQPLDLNRDHLPFWYLLDSGRTERFTPDEPGGIAHALRTRPRLLLAVMYARQRGEGLGAPCRPLRVPGVSPQRFVVELDVLGLRQLDASLQDARLELRVATASLWHGFGQGRQGALRPIQFEKRAAGRPSPQVDQGCRALWHGFGQGALRPIRSEEGAAPMSYRDCRAPVAPPAEDRVIEAVEMLEDYTRLFNKDSSSGFLGCTRQLHFTAVVIPYLQPQRRQMSEGPTAVSEAHAHLGMWEQMQHASLVGEDAPFVLLPELLVHLCVLDAGEPIVPAVCGVPLEGPPAPSGTLTVLMPPSLPEEGRMRWLNPLSDLVINPKAPLKMARVQLDRRRQANTDGCRTRQTSRDEAGEAAAAGAVPSPMKDGIEDIGDFATFSIDVFAAREGMLTWDPDVHVGRGLRRHTLFGISKETLDPEKARRGITAAASRARRELKRVNRNIEKREQAADELGTEVNRKWSGREASSADAGTAEQDDSPLHVQFFNVVASCMVRGREQALDGKSMPLVYLDDVLNPREKDRAYYKWRKRGVSSMLGSRTAWHPGHADRAQPPKGNAPPQADGWMPQAPREDAEQADGASPSEGKGCLCCLRSQRPVDVMVNSDVQTPEAVPLGEVVITHAGSFKGEYLYAERFTAADGRRYVHTGETGCSPEEDVRARWKISKVGLSNTDYIISHVGLFQDEHLYAAQRDVSEDVSDGQCDVVTWKKTGSPPEDPRACWNISKVGTNYVITRSGAFKDEYLYADAMQHGGGKRYVHTLMKGGSPADDPQALWTITPVPKMEARRAWVTIDLKEDKVISGLVVQGGSDGWVRRLRVEVAAAGNKQRWSMQRRVADHDPIFSVEVGVASMHDSAKSLGAKVGGIGDWEQVGDDFNTGLASPNERHRVVFDRPVDARYVRITPLTGEGKMCIRVGVILHRDYLTEPMGPSALFAGTRRTLGMDLLRSGSTKEICDAARKKGIRAVTHLAAPQLKTRSGQWSFKNDNLHTNLHTFVRPIGHIITSRDRDSRVLARLRVGLPRKYEEVAATMDMCDELEGTSLNFLVIKFRKPGVVMWSPPLSHRRPSFSAGDVMFAVQLNDGSQRVVLVRCPSFDIRFPCETEWLVRKTLLTRWSQIQDQRANMTSAKLAAEHSERWTTTIDKIELGSNDGSSDEPDLEDTPAGPGDPDANALLKWGAPMAEVDDGYNRPVYVQQYAFVCRLRKRGLPAYHRMQSSNWWRAVRCRYGNRPASEELAILENRSRTAIEDQNPDRSVTLRRLLNINAPLPMQDYSASAILKGHVRIQLCSQDRTFEINLTKPPREDTTFEMILTKEDDATMTTMTPTMTPTMTNLQTTMTPTTPTRMKLGFSIADHDEGLRISKIAEEGLVTEWNTKFPGMSVKVGDFVMKCNDKATRTEIYEELRSAKEFRLTIRTTQTTQDDAKLGFTIVDDDEGLRIGKIAKEGLVAEWNENFPRMSVKVGDFVMECNDKATRTEIYEELRSAKVLRLTIRTTQTTQEGDEGAESPGAVGADKTVVRFTSGNGGAESPGGASVSSSPSKADEVRLSKTGFCPIENLWMRQEVTLSIYVFSVEGLRQEDGAFRCPFMVASVNGEEREYEIEEAVNWQPSGAGSLNIYWWTMLTIQMPGPSVLKLELKDRNLVFGDYSLGELSIDLEDRWMALTEIELARSTSEAALQGEVMPLEELMVARPTQDEYKDRLARLSLARKGSGGGSGRTWAEPAPPAQPPPLSAGLRIRPAIRPMPPMPLEVGTLTAVDSRTEAKKPVGTLRCVVDMLPDPRINPPNLTSERHAFKINVSIYDVSGVSIFRDLCNHNDLQVQATLIVDTVVGTRTSVKQETDTHQFADFNASWNQQWTFSVIAPVVTCSLVLRLVDVDAAGLSEKMVYDKEVVALDHVIGMAVSAQQGRYKPLGLIQQEVVFASWPPGMERFNVGWLAYLCFHLTRIQDRCCHAACCLRCRRRCCCSFEGRCGGCCRRGGRLRPPPRPARLRIALEVVDADKCKDEDGRIQLKEPVGRVTMEEFKRNPCGTCGHILGRNTVKWIKRGMCCLFLLAWLILLALLLPVLLDSTELADKWG